MLWRDRNGQFVLVMNDRVSWSVTILIFYMVALINMILAHVWTNMLINYVMLINNFDCIILYLIWCQI